MPRPHTKIANRMVSQTTLHPTSKSNLHLVSTSRVSFETQQVYSRRTQYNGSHQMEDKFLSKTISVTSKALQRPPRIKEPQIMRNSCESRCWPIMRPPNARHPPSASRLPRRRLVPRKDKAHDMLTRWQ